MIRPRLDHCLLAYDTTRSSVPQSVVLLLNGTTGAYRLTKEVVIRRRVTIMGK